MGSVNNVPSALPPDLANFIKVTTPSLYIVAYDGIWVGIMIPLLVVLFVASDAPLRRKPIFIFNVISVFIGTIIGFLNIVTQMRSLQDPIHGTSPQFLMVPIGMTITVEFFVDSILLFRVYSVFPRQTTRKAIWFSILIPIVLLKIARLTNIIFSIVNAAKDIGKSPLEEIATVGYTLPETRIGWGLQLVDNAACSAIFLWKLKTTGHFRGSTSFGFGSTVVIDSYAARLKGLFWIATSNFVFPALFGIVLIAITTTIDIQKNTIFIILFHQSDIYIEIIGVLFATVWVANSRANIGGSISGLHTSSNGIQFVTNPVLATNRGNGSFKNVVVVPVERTESARATDDSDVFAFQPPKNSV